MGALRGQLERTAVYGRPWGDASASNLEDSVSGYLKVVPDFKGSRCSVDKRFLRRVNYSAKIFVHGLCPMLRFTLRHSWIAVMRPFTIVTTLLSKEVKVADVPVAKLDQLGAAVLPFDLRT